MKQEKLPLRKDNYLLITFKAHDGKREVYYRTNRPVRIETMGNGKPSYHVVQCDIYTYCDYWLDCDYWTLTQIESAEY